MNFLILTGGENKRIGNRKAFLKIGGTTLLERVLQQIEIVKEKGEEEEFIPVFCSLKLSLTSYWAAICLF